MNAQEIITDAVNSRGYNAKHATALVVRIWLKMAEEIMELGELLPLSEFDLDVSLFAQEFREAFDTAVSWGDDYDPYLSGATRQKICEETADIAVTVFNMGEALYKLTGVPFDVTEEALKKATKDIKRGIR